MIFDLPVVDFDEDHFLSKASKDSKHRGNGKPETFSFGRGDIMLRIYDKVKEIKQQSQKVWFYDLWQQKDDVWRIEIEARREFLKTHGIYTPENLFAHQGTVAHWILANHTSLRRPTGDSNRSRWPRHPLWQAAEKAALALEGLEQGNKLDLQAPKLFAKEKTLQSIEGMAKKPFCRFV